MSKLRFAPICMLLAAVGLTTALPMAGIAPLAYAADDGAKAETVRPEIGTPLQAAQALIKEEKYKEALAKIAETDAVGNKTAYEIFAIDRLRGAPQQHAPATPSWPEARLKQWLPPDAWPLTSRPRLCAR